MVSNVDLREIRKGLGLSLAQAARQVEVNSRTWCRWESGERRIPATAVKLFMLLNHVEKLPAPTLLVDISTPKRKPQAIDVTVVASPHGKVTR